MDQINDIGTMRAPKKKKRKSVSLDKKKARSGWWFVMPFIIGFFTVYMPMIVQSIKFSMLSTGGSRAEFVGLDNYIDALTVNAVFTQKLGECILQLAFDIPAIVIFSLFMAVLLNQKVLGRAVFRAIFFVPVILGTGLIDKLDNLANNSVMQNMQSKSSATNGSTSNTANDIISNYDLARLFEGMKVGTELVEYVTKLVNNIYSIINRSGVQLLIFLAGLQSISPAIYESCSIDGATTWETFWKITFPMVSPMILVNTVYTVIDAFTSESNEMMTMILEQNNTSVTKSAAMAWIYFLVVILIIAVVSAFVSAFVFYQRRD